MICPPLLDGFAIVARPAAGRAALLGRFLQVGDEILDVRLLPQPRKRHLVARDIALRVGDILRDRHLVPHDAGVHHGAGIAEVLDRPRRTADHAFQIRSDPVLLGVDHMAGAALVEHFLARCRIAVGQHRTTAEQQESDSEPDL